MNYAEHVDFVLKQISLFYGIPSHLFQEVSMLAEFVKELVGMANKARTSKITEIPGDPRNVLIDRGDGTVESGPVPASPAR